MTYEPSRARAELSPGAFIADRFRIERLAKTGGMGHVYRTRDVANGEARCAVKVLPPGEEAEQEDIDRFAREAEVLSRLKHPGIVSYVTHGFTTDGRPYLAMDWLDGEELSARLARGLLDVGSAIALITSLADALAFAHQSGIVHRDLKPANVILRDGGLDCPVLVDFGVARWAGRTMRQTRSGALIGTPEYMAPEQARGQFDVGPSADVFALGCILFEALTGKAPFQGDHVATVLTKILFEEVPPLRSILPDAPADLEALCARLLSKEPKQRPSDAIALLSELRALSASTPARPGSTPRRRPGGALSGAEQMLFSLVIASPRIEIDPESSTTVRAPSSLVAPLPVRGLSELGAQVERLADGSVAAVVSRAGNAMDQAAQAARCALTLLERMPGSQIVLVTGRGALGARGRVPEGEVWSRASSLLGRRVSAGDEGTAGIWLDDVSAGLLGPEFRVERELGSPVLLGLRAGGESGEGRSLLGRSIPVLGRERELGLLMTMLEGAIEEQAPGAAILIAPGGMGKSRLLHEMISRVRRDLPEVLVMISRGDPASSLSTYGLLVRALRQLAGVRVVDDAAEQRRKLEARITGRASDEAGRRAVAPLVEICEVQEADEKQKPPTPVVGDKPLAERVELALVTWLAAECADRPIVFAIEDLHAADAASSRAVGVALRSLKDAPFFVVATHRADDARPRVPWGGNVQEIRLGGLSKRASERLVRSALGDGVEPSVVTRLIEQAEGNPLYLEELIRAYTSGKTDAAPETVLAMLQARILRMTAGARRILRIASLFGDTFWRGGLLYLLGLDKTTDQRAVDPWLEELMAAEMINPHAESRFPGDREYGFRHGLMREAAYGLLTEDDRKLGHALVGLYLEQAGERDAAVLAGHTYEIVQYLERRHNSFFVSRLIMLTGLSLRKFTSATPDDPLTLKKIRRALATLLRSDQIDEVKYLFKDVERG